MSELRLRHVTETGWVRDWEGNPHLPEDEGVVCMDGRRIVGSIDWETVDAYGDQVSIENVWVHPDYRSSPRVLLLLIREFERRFPSEFVIVGEYANPKVEHLIDALNDRREFAETNL